MKKYFLAIIAAMLLAMPAMAQTKKGKTLEVSFNYQKQAGPGSNQYAVWIENEKGWDFTDQQGKKVKDGKYFVKVEATLYQASDIIYSGSFSTKDKAGSVTLTSKLSEPDETHKDMITDVKAVIK